jgi:hypothetical protein
MSWHLWPEEKALAPVNRRYRRRGPLAPWCRKLASAVLIFTLFGALTHAVSRVGNRSDAGASSDELRRIQATMAAADRALAELDAFKRIQPQIIFRLGWLDDAERDAVVRLLAEVHAILPHLEADLRAVKMGGHGLDLVREQMARLRKSFSRLCQITQVPCPAPPRSKGRLPVRDLPTGIFLARSVRVGYTSA